MSSIRAKFSTLVEWAEAINLDSVEAENGDIKSTEHVAKWARNEIIGPALSSRSR